MQRNSSRAITVAQKVGQAKPTRHKKHCPHIPEAKIVRIQHRHLVGQSNREIARAEHCGRSTISKIVKAPELQEHLQQVRERIWGMADCAADVVYEAIVEKRDVKTSYELLRDISVLPRASQIVHQPTQPTPEDGYSRQAIMVASVMLESHKNFDVDLPPGAREALEKLAKDAESREAKSAEAKLPRR
jgi:hypothetical protein